jgi:hypothetical protein
MENKAQLQLIIWLKRFFGVIAFCVWLYIIYRVMQAPAPFMEQAPYCMARTMLTFGVLTAIYKGLDYWSQGAGSRD